MTRKDYELIAAALREAKPDAGLYVQTPELEQWRLDVLVVRNALATDNPRFDRARFLTACGVGA